VRPLDFSLNFSTGFHQILSPECARYSRNIVDEPLGLFNVSFCQKACNLTIGISVDVDEIGSERDKKLHVATMTVDSIAKIHSSNIEIILWFDGECFTAGNLAEHFC
jgi:hypothetical protein